MLNQFDNFISFEQIHNEGFSCIPNKKGLYIVRKPQDMDIVFSPNTTAISSFKGRSLLYNIDALLSKFKLTDKEILKEYLLNYGVLPLANWRIG